MSCSQHIGGLVAARSALCELWLHGYGFCSLKQPIVLVVLVALSWSVEKAHFLQRQSEKNPLMYTGIKLLALQGNFFDLASSFDFDVHIFRSSISRPPICRFWI